MSTKSKNPPAREVWDKCITEAKREVPELKCDLPAIRAALRESRKRRTVRVRSFLP